MNKHLHIETFKIYKNKSMTIIFENGDHCYIDPEDMDTIFNTILDLYELDEEE